MSSQKSVRLFLILVALVLALAACRRGQTEAIPTIAATAAVEEPEGAAQPTEPATAATTAPEAEATAEPVVAQPVPVEAIDWAPQVVTSDPLPGSEIAANAPITVRFDQPMDQESVAAAFAIEPAVEGELSWPEPAVAVFTPAEALAEGQTYHVRVADSAASVNGQTLLEPVDFALQTTGPLAVTQVSPEDGATAIGTDAAITVVFNKPVVPLVSSGEQAGLPQPLTFDPPVAGAGEWTSTSIYRFVADPALAGSTSYTVSVDPALTDLTGSVIENPPTWQFTTLGPEIVTVEPENNAERIVPTTPITVTFNMPMNPTGVEGALSLTAGDEAVAYAAEWQEGNRAVVLSPDDLLPLASEITLTVGASAPSANGGATLEDDHVSTFTTVPLPAVASTFPADGSTADTWQRGFSVEFASPMNDDTVVDQFVIEPAPGDVDYFVNEWEGTYSVSLDFELVPNTTYTVTIPATAADPYGNTLGEDYVFTFNAPPFAPLASLNLPRDVAQLSTSFPTTVQVLHRNVTEVTVSLYDLGVNTDLIFNSYQINEHVPAGEPVFQTTIPVENVPDELGVIDVPLADGGVLPTGVYELRVNAPEVDADSSYWQVRNVVLVVADSNIVVKEMFGEVNVWVTDLASGQPAAGRELRLYKRNGEAAGTATSDANGFARFDYTPDEPYLEGVVVASNEPGAAGFGLASTLWTATVQPWQLGLTTDSGPEQSLYAYIYTDRPIFRPGDTVYYKGIVRTPSFGRYLLPDIEELEVSVNPNFFFGEDVDTFSETFTVTVDEDGVFNGELTLPEDMPLGSYSFNLTGDFWLSSRPFTVAEYRAPEFQVTVTPEQAEVLRGQATNVNVDVAYLFGGSAAGLPVNWNAIDSEYVPSFETAPAYAFGDTGDFNYEFNPFNFGGTETTVASGSGETDAAGHVTIPLPADLLAEADAGSRTVRVEVTVGGLGEFPVSGRTEVIFHSADGYVGLRPQNNIVDAGDEAAVDLLTVDWAGEALGNQSVEVVFYQRDWESERVVEFGQRVTQWTPVDTEVGRETVTTDADGQATVSFTPESGGTYLVVATLTDAGGREQMTSTAIWSVDAQFAGWRTDPNQRTMDVTTDKREYRPGETAQILVQSPFAQPVQAWLVVERGNIIDQQVITVEGSQIISLPITEEYAPNVHVTVVAIKPVDTADADFPYADIRVGFVEIVVPPDQFDLTVTLTPGAEEYAPGDTATFDIAVTDQAGNGVQSEVSVALVDLAVLLLKEDNAPHILDAFYFRQPLRSTLGSGLLITGEGLAIEEPLMAGGFGGGGGADELAASFRIEGEDDNVRQDFKDTAYWEARLMTDADGRASVEIPLPDNVTTWRLHSKAATTDTRVGQASVDILARLPLIIRPVTPRFFTVGDQVSLGANVNNNTDADIEATVTLEATGVTIDGEATQTVTVPAGGRQLVRWNVTVDDVETADLTFRVEGGEFSDASKPTLGVGPDALLPVYRYDGRDFVATAGELDEEGRRVEAVILPQGVDQRQGEVQVRLQPSLAAAIIESFDVIEADSAAWLECAGTYGDRLLYNASVEAAVRALELDRPDLQGRLTARVSADVTALQAAQFDNGGWGWCFSAEADPWISAQALLALSHAADLGYDVNAAVLDKGVAYLRTQLQPVDNLGDAAEANRQAFFLYVMAEAGENVADDADALVGEHRGLLDPYAKALLVMAYDLSGATGANPAALLTDLNDTAIMSATGAHWESAEQDFANLDSDIRGTAMVIAALARLQPDSPLLPPAVRWLMVARDAETWATLHQTAWSVSALSEWMAVSGELEPDYAYELLVNLQSRAAGSFTADNVTDSDIVRVPLNELVSDATNFFDFQRGAGDGRLYYTLRLDSAIAVDALDPISRGFTVERRYFDAACDPETETCEPIDSIGTDGQVRVELTIVVPNDRVYVMVEDPIPAGTDAIDPNLLTSQSGRAGGIVPAEGDNARGFWGWWYFDHIQYRDEKVVFVSQFLPAGTYQYTYYLQPNIPGVYQAMPATAREQFFPEVFGRSEGALFTITE